MHMHRRARPRAGKRYITPLLDEFNLADENNVKTRGGGITNGKESKAETRARASG